MQGLFIGFMVSPKEPSRRSLFHCFVANCSLSQKMRE